MNMKVSSTIKAVALTLTLCVGCQIDEQVNPNNPALEDILDGATKTDLNNLLVGAQANMRTSYGVYVTAMGTISRELYLFDADPRNTTDLIGNTAQGTLDNNSFYTTAPWISNYQTIKNLNIILQALPNADASVSTAEKDGYSGVAKTFKALSFLWLINAQNNNGIRIDVADPDNLGDIATKAEAFTEIASLLEEGYDDLATGEFGFGLTSGFTGFDTPATFQEFNRALAARVALYRGLYADALTYLGDSFYDAAGDLTAGPKMIFSTAGPDILNPVFKAPQQNGNQIIVHNDFIADAEAGDTRVTRKTRVRTNAASKSGLNGTHETALYASNVSPIDIIRNEELILIHAECNVQLGGANLATAVTSLDIIRTSAGLATLATAKPTAIGNQAELRDEVLHQRRYSLWCEGHRSIDLRRYDRLNDAYVDTDGVGLEFGEVIFTEFPIPATEN